MLWSLAHLMVLAWVSSPSTATTSECRIVEYPYDRPYFAIVFRDQVACGAALLSPIWSVTDKPCMVELGVRSAKMIRAGAKPFQLLEVAQTEICRGRCNMALVRTKGHFTWDATCRYIGLPKLGDDYDWEKEAHYVFAEYDPPWTKNALLAMTCDVITLSENCWDRNSDFYQFRYLCGDYDSGDSTKNFVDLCKDPHTGGLLVLEWTLVGFLVKKSCKGYRHLAFINIVENLEFIEGTTGMRGLRGNSTVEDSTQKLDKTVNGAGWPGSLTTKLWFVVLVVCFL